MRLCKHEETVFDTGRTFCLFCGVQREGPVVRSEALHSSRVTCEFSRQKYFVKALSIVLGEEPISESEMEVLRSVAGAAEKAVGLCAPKLHLKRFVLKQQRALSSVCRKHFPTLAMLNGHALPIVSSEQRRVMFTRYESSLRSFSSHSGKKNVSARNVIKDCLREFEAQGKLLLSPPAR